MEAITTTRLILRPWLLSDAPDMYKYSANPEVGPPAGWKPHESLEESLAVIKMFIEKDDCWAITLRDSGGLIGSIGLHGDPVRPGINSRMLGYSVYRPFWGHGFATEAAQAALSHAFDALGLNVVSVFHFPENARSKRVIEKCGFTFEGTLRHAHVIYDGTAKDSVCYSMLRSQYYDRKGSAK